MDNNTLTEEELHKPLPPQYTPDNFMMFTTPEAVFLAMSDTVNGAMNPLASVKLDLAMCDEMLAALYQCRKALKQELKKAEPKFIMPAEAEVIV